jgi:16S rRNA (uracil1498-N3)-methyltransferase
MEGALAQSEGAWLPQPFPEANLERAILAAPPGDRVVLDPAGEPLVGVSSPGVRPSLIVAVGPEGGIERDELEQLRSAGFRSACLGPTILRFETAAIAALAMARTWLGRESHPEPLEDA